MPKIVLLENIHPVARELLVSRGFEVETRPKALSEAELAEALSGVDFLGIRSKTQITPTVLAAARDLRAIGAFCIGTNQIALESATRAGIAVFNAPFANTRSVAELILAEVIALARRLCDRSAEMHVGTWKKAATGSYEVRGRTLGVVGYGHIGRQIGVLAETVGMRVLFYDVAARLPMGNNQPRESLESLLAESDFVTLHVPETPQTTGMVGAVEIARMKPGSYLLNASRGTVVDLEALADALRRGHLAGAAVDVYPLEPEANDSHGFTCALSGLPNVILTPHVGGSTAEAQEAIGREVAGTLLRFLGTGSTAGSVNFPQLDIPVALAGTTRVANVHRNVPGVLRDVNRIVSDHDANIVGQVLSTTGDIGYLVMDLDRDVAMGVCRDLAKLDTSIRTNVIG